MIIALRQALRWHRLRNSLGWRFAVARSEALDSGEGLREAAIHASQRNRYVAACQRSVCSRQNGNWSFGRKAVRVAKVQNNRLLPAEFPPRQPIATIKPAG
ncbi:MAG: hypothetical protein BGO16_10580 [Nitrobacter sp. 62-23]|nr:MAG: hypothetical protein BGO16_10580 [Nitrobacter sp. 62-23]